MKYGNRPLALMIRVLFGGMGCLFCVPVFLIIIAGERNEAYLPGILFMTALMVACWLFSVYAWQQDAPGEMTPEGIYVRVLIRKRFYPWSSIRQAGVLWRMGKYDRYNELILLKQNGSPRGYRDRRFLLRNLFKTIHIPYNDATKQYIIDHYGPLNFDLSDGRPEKSEVVENTWKEEM